MRIVVIVVTYNGGRWVNKCFDSLTKSVIPLHILAIDNASSDDTVSQIQNRFPHVEIIETGANLGFGKANNIGLKIAIKNNADYVFLLNQDAWIETNTISILVKIAEAKKEYGIISPFHLLPDQRKLEWYFSTFIAPEKCRNLYSDIYFNKTEDIYELEFVNAAAWLITKDCLLRVGGFDPLFPHYGEDDDYCCRARYKGIKIGVAPSSQIFHDITYRSWDEIKFNKQRQLIFSFIELKDMRYSYKFALFNFTKTRIDKLVFLLFTRKWKELSFLINALCSSYGYVIKINKSRKLSKEECAYLN